MFFLETLQVCAFFFSSIFKNMKSQQFYIKLLVLWPFLLVPVLGTYDYQHFVEFELVPAVYDNLS